jgi:hypothetical protein
MGNTADIIAAATAEIKAKPGYSFDPAALVAAIEAGLADGDRIDLGYPAGSRNGKLIAHVVGDVVEMHHRDKVTPVPITKLPEEARVRLLVLKGKQAACR